MRIKHPHLMMWVFLFLPFILEVAVLLMAFIRLTAIPITLGIYF